LRVPCRSKTGRLTGRSKRIAGHADGTYADVLVRIAVGAATISSLEHDPCLDRRELRLTAITAPATNKNPAEWPGRGLRPTATPGEEMEPRI
jgi:hypothetical protein